MRCVSGDSRFDMLLLLAGCECCERAVHARNEGDNVHELDDLGLGRLLVRLFLLRILAE